MKQEKRGPISRIRRFYEGKEWETFLKKLKKNLGLKNLILTNF